MIKKSEFNEINDHTLKTVFKSIPLIYYLMIEKYVALAH